MRNERLRANKICLKGFLLKILLFRLTNKSIIIIPKIKLNHFLLSPENPVTYPGIRIGETLSWNNKIDILTGKLRRTNIVFSKLRIVHLFKS